MEKELIEILPSLKAVIEYLYNDEEKHWIEYDRPHNHIFMDIRTVRKFINSNSTLIASGEPLVEDGFKGKLKDNA